jgi:hypothetical protein
MRRLAREGRVIARKFGRDWQFDADSITGYARGQQVG